MLRGQKDSMPAGFEPELREEQGLASLAGESFDPAAFPELGAETAALPAKMAAALPIYNPIEQARNATVFIRTPWGSGSGFFVDGRGRIVTNRHVVEYDQDQLDKLKDPDLLPSYTQILQRRQAEHDKYQALKERLQGQLRNIDYYSPLADLQVVLADGTELGISDVAFSDNFDLALLSLQGWTPESVAPMRPSRPISPSTPSKAQAIWPKD